jgi:heat shock protein HtpX
MHAPSSILGLDDKDLPKVFVIPAAEPNAFAAGTKRCSVVALTTGLLTLLTPAETRAVVAHEVGHLRNGDVPR